MRTRMNGIVNISWTVGLCFLPLLAYFSRSWVTLGLLTSSVTLIFFLYYTFLPESPRWLVSQERYDEAATILYQIGEKNKKVVEKNELVQKLQKLGERMKKEKTVDKVENSSLDLLRYPQLRKKFIIITFFWNSKENNFGVKDVQKSQTDEPKREEKNMGFSETKKPVSSFRNQ
ncbi:Solute carrier family 22 member 3 like protein [Argiope bruennichi]|uniref:Solute carrier family 22 member 3 like protein n=1 Tax=Argiope bruennichi TaxID=94029 RepID=A0A8T0FV72_ARGBR|nr:Solute carrier family 22 member 3 like protein [Argiope bruennichi]